METKISGSSRRALCSNTSPIHFLFSICGTPLVDIHYICVPLSQNRVEMSHACRFCSHLDFMPFAKACCNWHSPQRCLVFVFSINQRSLTVRISTRNSTPSFGAVSGSQSHTFRLQKLYFLTHKTTPKPSLYNGFLFAIL